MKVRLGATAPEEREVIKKILENEDEKTKADRIKLIEACGASAEPSFVASLLAIAKTSRWHLVRRAALQGLQQFNNAEIGPELLAAYPELPKQEGVRAKALDVLSKRLEWSLELLAAIEQQKLKPSEVPFEVQERIRLHNNPEIHRLAKKIWGTARQTSDEKRKRMDEIAKILQNAKGNAIHGKQLFAASCATCHKLHGEGNAIGPDLTGYERDNLDFWLLAIVDPSAGIREEYTNFELETTDGLLLTGFILERAAQTVTIQDGEQGRVTIPKSRIKSLRASAVSRMPEGLLDSLGSEDIRDLFAYLRSPGPVATAP